MTEDTLNTALARLLNQRNTGKVGVHFDVMNNLVGIAVKINALYSQCENMEQLQNLNAKLRETNFESEIVRKFVHDYLEESVGFGSELHSHMVAGSPQLASKLQPEQRELEMIKNLGISTAEILFQDGFPESKNVYLSNRQRSTVNHILWDNKDLDKLFSSQQDIPKEINFGKLRSALNVKHPYSNRPPSYEQSEYPEAIEFKTPAEIPVRFYAGTAREIKERPPAYTEAREAPEITRIGTEYIGAPQEVPDFNSKAEHEFHEEAAVRYTKAHPEEYSKEYGFMFETWQDEEQELENPENNSPQLPSYEETTKSGTHVEKLKNQRENPGNNNKSLPGF